jgi:hypothetical protein
MGEKFTLNSNKSSYVGPLRYKPRFYQVKIFTEKLRSYESPGTDHIATNLSK